MRMQPQSTILDPLGVTSNHGRMLSRTLHPYRQSESSPGPPMPRVDQQPDRPHNVIPSLSIHLIMPCLPIINLTMMRLCEPVYQPSYPQQRQYEAYQNQGNHELIRLTNLPVSIPVPYGSYQSQSHSATFAKTKQALAYLPPHLPLSHHREPPPALAHPKKRNEKALSL